MRNFEIDTVALKNNFDVICSELSSNVKIAPVIKDNAYGHGAVKVAKLLDKEARIEFFSVATYAEAFELLESGIMKPILILAPLTGNQTRECVKRGLHIGCGSIDYAKEIARVEKKTGIQAFVHYKIDTGMGRLGFNKKGIFDVLSTKKEITGLWTHLAVSEEEDNSYTSEQLEKFKSSIEEVNTRGLKVRYVHAANSGGIFFHPASHFNMVRPGIVLYGFSPAGREDDLERRLMPVLSVKAKVCRTETIEPGTTIGYGRKFRATRPTCIATVLLGYGQGLRRSLSNRFYCLINGKKASIVGTISMDFCMVDVTEIQTLREEVVAVFIGQSGGVRISARQMAEILDTIPYEICTGWNLNMERTVKTASWPDSK